MVNWQGTTLIICVHTSLNRCRNYKCILLGARHLCNPYAPRRHNKYTGTKSRQVSFPNSPHTRQISMSMAGLIISSISSSSQRLLSGGRSDSSEDEKTSVLVTFFLRLAVLIFGTFFFFLFSSAASK